MTHIRSALGPTSTRRSSGRQPRLPRNCDDRGRERIATFLERYASGIETAAEQLVAMAHAETALPVKPRLAEVELPRTTGQLRDAAARRRSGSWLRPTIDTQAEHPLVPRAARAGVGVWAEQFSVRVQQHRGGDFAAAIATGNPGDRQGQHARIPARRGCLAEAASRGGCADRPAAGQRAADLSHEPRRRRAGRRRSAAPAPPATPAAARPDWRSKAAADRGRQADLSGTVERQSGGHSAGGDRDARRAEIAGEFAGSCLMGTGQFCTNPGLVILLAGAATRAFMADVAEQVSRPRRSARCLSRGVATVAGGQRRNAGRAAGAKVLVRRHGRRRQGLQLCQHAAARLRGEQFLAARGALQTEAFGNASLVVVADDAGRRPAAIVDALEGNLTGCDLLRHRRQRRRAVRANWRRACGAKSAGCSTTRCRPAWPSARR